MPHRRDIRRLAMQVLYQFDLRGGGDAQAILEGLNDGPDAEEVRGPAFALASEAWATRLDADRLVRELAPAWPTHRQPPVDKAILRLAHHEMVSGRAPLRVVINEAVELAKTFSGEASPAFVNGVLDKLAKRLAAEGKLAPAGEDASADASASAGPSGAQDAWLDDALARARPASPAAGEEAT